MQVEIDIMDEAHKVIATATWIGRSTHDAIGKWTCAASSGSEEQLAQLEEMIASRADLRAADFRSISGDGWVKGGEGFEGNLSVLRIVAPVLGLTIGDPRLSL